MAGTEEESQDLTRRAYVNLTSLRNNLPPGYVTDATFYYMFQRALDQLQQAGHDVVEWRLPHNAKQRQETDSSEFLARIDAVLGYFTVLQEKMVIGFRK
jgi:Asp-tRNA(Asn)/Glu-tRNA(Gln) amidotransferase A subunit family amidase